MDWFLYDRELRHERVNINISADMLVNCIVNYIVMVTGCIKLLKV